MCFCGYATSESGILFGHTQQEHPELTEATLTLRTNQPEGYVIHEHNLPVVENLERLVEKLKAGACDVVTPADLRELQKAIGLIDAIVFTPEESTDA